MDDKRVVGILVEAVPDVIVIYRFGSTASGDTHRESDVDLALLASRTIDPMERFALQEQLAAALHRNVDLVDLRAASTVMRMEVVSRGTALAVLNRPEKERFENFVFSSYARLNEERRAILDQVLRQGSVHGR